MDHEEKTNWTYCGRLNARGHEQVYGSHYASNSIATLVTNPITMHIILTLWCMNAVWMAVIIDVEGAFLQGQFENDKELYIDVPNGFEELYPGDVVLRMNVPLYETKHVTYCFFKCLRSL